LTPSAKAHDHHHHIHIHTGPAAWARQRGFDPGPWRLLEHSGYSIIRSEAIPVKDLIEYRHEIVDVAPDDTTATEEER
jgi:hypothetical protein